MVMDGRWPVSGGASLPLQPGKGPSPPGAAKAHSSGHGETVPEVAKRARFPLKAALTASGLATTGDTAAQLWDRWKRQKPLQKQSSLDLPPGKLKQPVEEASLLDHDWQRALRMASYGFLIYGPGSQLWYEVLDHFLPQKTLTNLSVKVVANQLVLGPCVIMLVFAWNSAWEGRLKHLPELYRTRALSTLLDGWKFWFPASVVNFGVLPLQMRVAFMSTCSIFWNFYLSNTMTASKSQDPG